METSKPHDKNIPPGPAVLNTFIFIALLYCSLFTVFFSVVIYDSLLFGVHLIALTAMVINYFIIKRTKNYSLAANIFLGIGMIVVTSLFYSGGWENTGYIWSIIYFSLIFFLKRGKAALAWVIVLLGESIILTALHFTKLIELPYSNAIFFNYYVGQLFTWWLMFLFQKATVNYEAYLKEKKEAQERFENLLEAAPDAMVIVDRTGNITLINKQTEKLFGYTRDELVGKKVEVLMSDRYASKHSSHRQGFFGNPHARPMGSGLKLFGKRKDGSEFSIEISLSFIPNADLAVAAIRDVSERIQLTEYLATQNRQLENFAQITTTHLKEPVSDLSSLLKFYRETETPEGKKLTMQKIELTISKLEETLHQLLETLRSHTKSK